MRPTAKIVCQKRRGAALIISMIFVLVFSALAISMATMSGTNVQLASNQHKVNSALSAAFSGLEVLRYYLSDISIRGEVAPADRLEAVATELKDNVADVTNISANYDSATKTITIPSVILASQNSQDFSGVINQLDDNTLQLTITGTSHQIERRIGVNFKFASTGNSVFDFGIATKGPLCMTGNIDIDGLNESIEADVYIESENDNLALSMTGKSAIAGNVSIVNNNAVVDISNTSSVGGEQGEDASNNISIGTDPREFPVPNTAYFEQYIENTFDPATDTTTNLTLENIRILAGTNPHFSGSVILRGIIFIESPNIVKFSGNTSITGIIIADGDLDCPSSENHLEFLGSIETHSVSELPDEGFGDIKQETGTFLLAPGFSASFGGSFEAINGVIAASGIKFFGNAGGTINGSVVNYADSPMTLDGNTDLVFNRSGAEEDPAGFGSSKVLEFQPNTYSEPTL